jgi:Lon protease-like protein
MYSADTLLADAEKTAAFLRALERLPMFPLPNVVLLPNTFLPLHIFEPRYRKMTRDMLEGNRLVAMALQLGAADPLLAEDDGPPPVATIAGVGEVVMAQDLPDGRFNLVLRGRARVRIERELPSDEPYRIVRAIEIPDDPPSSEIELLDAEASLRALAGGLAEALPEGGDLLKQVVASQASASALVDVVASTLIADPRLRQELLETTDVARRITRVSAEVAAMAAELTSPRGWN